MAAPIEKVAVETACVSCGDPVTVTIPGDEDPDDTYCVPCAEAEIYDEDDPDPVDLNPEGDPTLNGAFG